MFQFAIVLLIKRNIRDPENEERDKTHGCRSDNSKNVWTKETGTKCCMFDVIERKPLKTQISKNYLTDRIDAASLCIFMSCYIIFNVVYTISYI